MTQTYFPFDLGAGANVLESQWRQMARLWLGTGVIGGQLNMLACYGDSTGLHVKVPTGQAWIEGHFYQSDVEETLTITTADPTNPRIDRVVVRADFVANTIGLAVIDGTPAGSPTAPSLTQTADVVWEIPIAAVAVAASASTIAAADVTDERKLIRPNDACQIRRVTVDQAFTNDTYTDLTSMYFEAEANEVYEVETILFHSGSTGADLKLKYVVPSGAAGNSTMLTFTAAAAANTDIKLVGQDMTSDFVIGTLGAAPRTDPAIMRGLLVMGSTMGRVKIQMAQNTDTGTSTVDAGSYMIARRVR